MPRRCAAILVLLSALMLPVAPAMAHKLKVFATAIGNRVEGRVYFVGGAPALGVPVTLRDSQHALISTVLTGGDQGTFVMILPYRDDFIIGADARDGHVASFVLEAARLSQTLPPAPGAPSSSFDAAEAGPPAQPAEDPVPADPGLSDAIDAALARQLAPLIDEIDGLRETVGLRDIIGGVGFIFGAFGLWALVITRRKRP